MQAWGQGQLKRQQPLPADPRPCAAGAAPAPRHARSCRWPQCRRSRRFWHRRQPVYSPRALGSAVVVLFW